MDTTEYMFKLALLQRKFDAVLAMIKGSALCGQSIISYLQAKVLPLHVQCTYLCRGQSINQSINQSIDRSITPFQHYGWVCPRRSCVFVLQASLS